MLNCLFRQLGEHLAKRSLTQYAVVPSLDTKSLLDFRIPGDLGAHLTLVVVKLDEGLTSEILQANAVMPKHGEDRDT